MKSLDYSKLFAEVNRQVKEEASKKAARQRELFNKDITSDMRIVAWVDILGFSQMLQNAKTDEELRGLYRKMLFAQEEFGAVTASDDPERTRKINVDFGRSVVALSDGLVVTASANARARSIMSPYDLLMSFIGDIIEAQANCVANGIFLRGGISIGPYYFDNNILLSPALIRAYKLETDRATYPVIIINRSDVDALRKLPGIRCYAPSAEPSRSYFRPFKSPSQRKGERFYFLDYLRFLADPSNHTWSSNADLKKYRNSSSRARIRIMRASYRKTAAMFMWRHRKHVLNAYKQSNSERIRAKYCWLIEYHNKTIRESSSISRKAQIDLQQCGNGRRDASKSCAR